MAPTRDTFPLGQSSDHNWDPLNGGTNRFATIFLYHAMPPFESTERQLRVGMRPTLIYV